MILLFFIHIHISYIQIPIFLTHPFPIDTLAHYCNHPCQLSDQTPIDRIGGGQEAYHNPYHIIRIYSHWSMDLPVPQLLCIADLTTPGEAGALLSFSTALHNYQDSNSPHHRFFIRQKIENLFYLENNKIILLFLSILHTLAMPVYYSAVL